jgi:CO dehydrogenase/acetyl-CoA synthase gamma subunit (corrinoid Fe-S protein)
MLIFKKDNIPTASMPFSLRLYSMLRSFGKHKLNIGLKDIVENPSTSLILQLEFITNTIDMLLETENASIEGFEDELEDM